MAEKYYKTEDIPLEPKELRKLKQGFFVIPIFLLIFVGFFVFLFNMLNPKDGFFFWMPVGFAVFFAGLMGYIIWGFVMDLRTHSKQVFQGLITKKELKRHSGKSSSRSYYLLFGEKRMRVELHIFNKFEEGDLIEIHRSKRLYNMIYQTKLLKRDAAMQAVAEVKHQQLNKQQMTGFILIFLFVAIVATFVASVFFGWIDW
ncbi:MAG: hypothetical protein R8G66_00065 [Cytophagales bacterium]|nr:hypothetical protein [Cytophagales bacterium]